MGSEQLLAYLKTNCPGRNRAEKSAALEQALRISGNELRRQVNRLRRKGLPIGSSRDGYFYAVTAGEVYATIRQPAVERRGHRQPGLRGGYPEAGQPGHAFLLRPALPQHKGYYQNIGEAGFHEADHIRLRDALLGIGGKFLLFYNDDSFVRALYSGPGIMLQELVRPNLLKNRYEKEAQFRELLIANYDMNETAQLTLFQ